MKREDPSPSKPKTQNPKQVTKDKGTNYVPKFTPIARSILKEKGWETWKNNKPWRTFTFNDGVFQKIGGFSF